MNDWLFFVVCCPLSWNVKWHQLSRAEQGKYYERARQERQLHMELYPGWSARDNYGYVSKKKKRKKDKSPTDSGGITQIFFIHKLHILMQWLFIYITKICVE